MKVNIIYEDNHYIAINKPRGLLAQGDITGDDSALDWVKKFIKEKYNKPGNVFLGLIHRIDRPTSGTLLLAKTSKGLARGTELFRVGKIEKEYLALVENRPEDPKGELRNYLRKDRSKNLTKIYDKPVTDSKLAILNYEYKFKTKSNRHLLKVKLETGRSHQIRVQLAHIGCPICGDLKYKAKTNPMDNGIALHSHSLSFTHPVKKEAIVISSLPEGGFWDRGLVSILKKMDSS
jgi:23S rRNA pseudouridine1911/1915/1917 synthase